MRSPTPAFTMMPLVPETSTPPSPAPSPQSSVMALVIVTAPNPPGSRQSISPPGAVLEIAPAHVLHGAVRLHGLTSSPTPDTQVRLACAYISEDPTMRNASNFTILVFRIFANSPFPNFLDLCADTIARWKKRSRHQGNEGAQPTKRRLEV